MAEPHFDNRVWGGIALRGVVAILFGILALSRPGVTIAALVLLFGAYALIDGIFAIASSIHVAELHGRWWPMLLVGILGIAIGILTFISPAGTLVGLIYYFAIWAVLAGVFEIAAAFRLRKVIPDEWLLGLAGVLSVACGILIGLRPGAGALSIIWFLGMFAIVFGFLQLGLSLRMHGTIKRLAQV
jgi:uncharacterized membrane protein HdeD (DUF308 family)